MSKPFYTDYVRHMLRFYCRNLVRSEVIDESGQKNWQSCFEVVSALPENDRQMIVEVYGNYDNLPDHVCETAEKHKVKQGYIWDLMKDVERKVAENRGLI